MQYPWTWLTKSNVIKAIEDTIQDSIAINEQSREALKRLDGKSLVVVIKPPGITFSASVHGEKIRITQQTAETHTPKHPDVSDDLSITGSPISLAKLALAEDKQSVIESEPLRIEGATRSLYAWQTLFKSLNIEWEMHLADRIGSIPAKLVITPLRFLRQQAKETMHNLSGNIEHAMVWNDYAVAEQELKNFSNRSHDLRARVENLSARLDKLR